MTHRLLTTVAALCATLMATAGVRAESIPPAVVRVMAAENGAASFGSGSLVAVNRRYGLVVTNWHVVRDTNGFIVVSFPDGFRSTATVVGHDRDWDLAALAIWRPNVEPIPLSASPPRPGEPLAIAGYGKGNYRFSSGRCTQYLSPGGHLPHEMVEVSTSARQGDSGGPIFNTRGELAGVLWGTGMGYTMGSYCGRVRQFLDPLMRYMDDLDRADAANTMIAGNAPGDSPDFRAQAQSDAPQPSPNLRLAAAPSAPAYTPWQPPVETAPLGAPLTPNQPQSSAVAAITPTAGGCPDFRVTREAVTAKMGLSPLPDLEPDRFAGLKTFLAIAGAVLLSLHMLRFLGRAVG